MADPDRRSFLRWACHGLGAVFAAVLGVPAVLYLIDPRHRTASQSDMKPVSGIKLGQLALNDPKQGVIRDIRRDAWTLHPNDVIGRVWVIRKSEGSGKEHFQVFTTVCPHLGCSVNCLQEPVVHFKCPCHDAEFDPNGTRVHRAGYDNAAPRDMDTLEFDVARDPDNPDENNLDLLVVRYQTFEAGKAVKTVRA